MLPQYAPELPEHETVAVATVPVPTVTVDESKERPAEMLPVGISVTVKITSDEWLARLPFVAIREMG